MKVTVFGLREDEKKWFSILCKQYSFEIAYTDKMLTMETVAFARGSQAVFIVAMCKITKELAKELKKAGIEYILTRSTGYDHIDLKALTQLEMKAANVPVYSHSAVPEYTILMILALIKNFKQQLMKTARRDFSLEKEPAKELSEMTVGLFGTGFIGSTSIKILQGFGCKLLAVDPYPNRTLEDMVCYTSKETLFRESDLIFFHCKLTKDNLHMINQETIRMMKEGVYLVNTARGEIMDFAAVIQALESGKIAGLAIDVYDQENQYVRKNCEGVIFQDGILEKLLSMSNVILTPHVAFHTEVSVRNQIEVCFKNLENFIQKGSCDNQLIDL